MKAMWQLELAVAGVVCAIVWIGTLIFISQMQPVQDTIVSEAKESDLIRAIYIDEYARNFVRYGMKFMLEAGLEDLSQRGGLKPGQSTVQGGKAWVNLTADGRMDVPSLPVDNTTSIPVDRITGITYYRWCTNLTEYDCSPARMPDAGSDEQLKGAVGESLSNTFSITEYLAKFSQYTQFYPVITGEGQVILFSDNNASAEGDFRVVVRVGSYAGVNSSEHIRAETPTDLYSSVTATTAFVASGGGLDGLIDAMDLCSPPTGSAFLPSQWVEDFEEDLNSTSVGSYSQWAQVVGSGEETPGTNYVKRCMTFETVHHLSSGFTFMTEIQKCLNC